MNRAARKLLRVSRQMGRSGESVVLTHHRFRESDEETILRARAKSSGASYVVQARIRGKEIAVHCGCDDFAYTFYPALAASGLALEAVERPESKGTGPRRAISETGVCKHLMALLTRD